MNFISNLTKILGYGIAIALGVALIAAFAVWFLGAVVLFAVLAVVWQCNGVPFNLTVTQPDGTKKVVRSYRYFRRVI